MRKFFAGPMLGPNRAIERSGVRKVVDFFESHDCVVQPVNLENDFGKDLYVDLTRDRMVTGTTFAAQVKSGKSYRTSNGYEIPVGKHYEYWRSSTVPVIGIVYDPEEDELYWTDISTYLQLCSDPPGSIPVQKTDRLKTDSLPMLEAAVRRYSTGHDHVLARLWSDDLDDARQAVWDCLAMGRHDFRILIGLRASVAFLAEDLLPSAIFVLSHVTSHPDIFWHGSNWVVPEVCQRVRHTFRWNPREVRLFVGAPGEDEWGRGTLGQSVCLLLAEDPEGAKTTLEAVRQTYPSQKSWMLFLIYLHLCEDSALECLNKYIHEFPLFREDPVYLEIVEHIESTGMLLMYD